MKQKHLQEPRRGTGLLVLRRQKPWTSAVPDGPIPRVDGLPGTEANAAQSSTDGLPGPEANAAQSSTHGVERSALVALLSDPMSLPNHEQKNRRTNIRTNRNGSSHKINEIQLKSKELSPKLCTDEIHLGTNSSPKNHCLRLSQTPGNWDLSQERK